VPPPPRWKTRLRRLEKVFNARAASPRAKYWLLGSAFALFVVISVLSFRALPNGLHFHWWVLPVLMLVTTPMTVAANSAEYRVMGEMGGHHVGWLDSARLTVIAGAANLLPLPGGIVIRTQALRLKGSSYRRALAANAVAGITWVGTGCVVIAVLFFADASHRVPSIVLMIVGVACLIAVAVMLRRIDPTVAGRLLTKFLIVETATVGVSGLRMFLAFKLIGLSASPTQAVALTASLIIAAALGIFPAGLGIREVLAGAIGTAVSLSASESVAATASDRVSAQAGLSVIAFALLVQERRRARKAGSATEQQAGTIKDELTQAISDPNVRTVDLP
jgi:hypothetical protein